MKSSFFPALLCALTVLFSSGCRKDPNPPDNIDLSVLKAQAQAEQSLAVILETVQENISLIAELNSGLPNLSLGQCPVVTVSSGGFPLTLTLDFGAGCTTAKGYEMAGVISASVSGKTDVPGASIVLTFNNLEVNENKVGGTITMTTGGTSGAAQQDIAFTGSNITVVTSDGKNVRLDEMDGERIQIEGKTTTPKSGGKEALSDDVFSIGFEGKGVDAEGKNFTVGTSVPLRREYDCRYIVSGKIDYNAGLVDKSADYGTGVCDNTLEVTVGGVKKTIELP